MEQICDDFDAEYQDLRRLVADLDEAGWHLATPAEGWTIHDQIGHLAFFDDQAVLAYRDPERFAADLGALVDDLGALEDIQLETSRALTGPDLMVWWDTAHAALTDVYRTLDPRERVLWYGPAMAAKSKITARLMETWAHGQDVADALGVDRQPTDRIRHICHLAVRARPYAYMVNELTQRHDEISVALTGPAGDVWTWGDGASINRIDGPAVDFALVATQRRHREDTALVATGPVAIEWLSIAQAFAGPAGSGRPPSVPD